MKNPDWIEHVLRREFELDAVNAASVLSDEEVERVRRFVAAHGGDAEALRAAFTQLPENEQRVIKETVHKYMRQLESRSTS
jgi:hypothetical protein